MGKSSVLEAVSGLKLPKGGGVTTRSPIRINIHNENGLILLKSSDGRDKPLDSKGLDKNTYEAALGLLLKQQQISNSSGVRAMSNPIVTAPLSSLAKSDLATRMLATIVVAGTNWHEHAHISSTRTTKSTQHLPDLSIEDKSGIQQVHTDRGM